MYLSQIPRGQSKKMVENVIDEEVQDAIDNLIEQDMRNGAMGPARDGALLLIFLAHMHGANNFIYENVLMRYTERLEVFKTVARQMARDIPLIPVNRDGVDPVMIDENLINEGVCAAIDNLIEQDMNNGAMDLVNVNDGAVLLVFLIRMRGANNLIYENVLMRYTERLEVFEIVARQMATDSRSADNDELRRELMYDLWTNYVREDGLPNEETLNLFSLNPEQESAVVTRNYQLCQIAHLRILTRVCPKSGITILSRMAKVATQNLPSSSAMKTGALAFVDNAPKLVPFLQVGLVVAGLTYECYDILRKWWSGEISRPFAVKRFIDAVAVCGGVYLGGELGATVGTMIAPGVGTLIGGAAGSLVGAYLSNNLSGWATSKIFNVPKKQSVEEAYHFLGVKHDAPNIEVNSAYRRKCLMWHSDRDNSEEARQNWYKLQLYMTVIRLAREDGLADLENE